MPQQKIFLSAVTGQFEACRNTLRSDLAAVGADVVVQEDLQQHGGTLLKKLEEYIGSCDRVIALVGSAYGWAPEPAALSEHAPSRSYTQWEYYFARGERLDGTTAAAKPVYVYFAAPNYLEQYPVEQSDTEAQRQQQFIEAIRASGKDRNEFDSIDNLARLVLRDGFTLSSADEHLLQNLPYDSLGPLFKGRDDFIKKIQANLSSDTEHATAIVAKQAIHGLGGVGKTRVTVEYAWRCLADYTACLFVTADSRENLNRNLAELCGARLLNLPQQAAQEQQEAAALDWLNRHPGWLLILDNVDTPESAKAVEELLPSLQNGHVLITSRRTNWGNSINTLPLDTLGEDDAVAFLLDKTEDKRSATDTDASDARTLAKMLDGLALALEQAGAFINTKRISLLDYQQRWAQQEQKLRNWHDEQVMQYPMSLAITWVTSFEQLTPGAQALLNLLCWFAPEPIPHETFATAFREILAELKSDAGAEDIAVNPPVDLEDLLDELETLSLLKWETGNRSFSIHRLVQEITQVRLNDDEHGSSLLAAVKLVDKALPFDPPPNDIRAWPVWDPLLPHIEHLIHAANEAGITEPTTRLMNDMGLCLYEKGLFHEAEPLMRHALAIDVASYGSGHPYVAIRLINLASLLLKTDRLAEAEPLMRRALAIDEASYGSEHPNVSSYLNNLAQLLQATNRLAEAEPLMRRALAIDEASYGSKHPEVAVGLNNLASLLQAANRLEEAEPLMRRALAIDVASYGSEHPYIANRLSNLASLLQATNRLEEAELLMRHALAIIEASYGSKHPDVAIILSNLALLLRGTNRLAEAEPLMRRALAIDVASYGSEHPYVARDLNNLALLLKDTNRLAEAEPLMRQNVEIILQFSERTGYEHPQLNVVLENYRIQLAAMGRDEEEIQVTIESLNEAAKRRMSS